MRFDSRVTIEPDTGRAILWADTTMGTRFRVVIDPQYAIDLWGLRPPIELSHFLAAIMKSRRPLSPPSRTVSWSFNWIEIRFDKHSPPSIPNALDGTAGIRRSLPLM